MDAPTVHSETGIENGDWASQAVAGGPETQEFDVARKLGALAAMLVEATLAPETAAVEADAALFEKTAEHQAGAGELREEDAVEAIGDRRAAAFAAGCRTFLAEAVESGCEAAGVWVGAVFGSPEVGYSIGNAIGRALNRPVGECATRGARCIARRARRVWQDVQQTVEMVVQRVAEWLLG